MTAIVREVIIGPCRLILGDAVAVATELSADWHAVVADPPYGIGFLRNGGGRVLPGCVSTRFQTEESRIFGDDAPYDPRPLLAICRERPVVLWGANHFAQRLPASGSWLFWRKATAGQLNKFSMGDGELAWLSSGGRCRYRKHTWSGHFRQGTRLANGRVRFHPTQKPVEIMQWCIELLPKKPKPWGDTIIDPYMGSGSTAIAAIQAGVKFIGVEMSERWFDVAVDRVRKYVEATA